MSNKPFNNAGPGFYDDSQNQLTIEMKKAEDAMQKAKWEVSEQEFNLKNDRNKNQEMREDIAN